MDSQALLTLLANQQTVLTSIAQALSAGSGTGQSVTTQPSVARSLPTPKLTSSESLTITQFRDWNQRWNDFSTAQKLNQCALDTHHGILRSALDSEWTMLWKSSRLGIAEDDDTSEIITKMEQYLRGKRNPLLDRQEFHRRDQQPGESVDHYFAALKALDDVCAHEDEFTCEDETCGGTCFIACADCNETFNLSYEAPPRHPDTGSTYLWIAR